MRLSVFLLLFIVLSSGVYSQTLEENLSEEFLEEVQEDEEEEGKFSIAAVIGHTFIYGANNLEGEEIARYVPMMAIDFNYFFSEKFGLGLHTDIIYETIFLEGEGEEEIERTRPVAPALMLSYKLNKHFSVAAGIGAEFTSEEIFGVNRLSFEYGAPIKNGWEFFALLSQDFRWEIYNTTSLGLGLSKRF